MSRAAKAFSRKRGRVLVDEEYAGIIEEKDGWYSFTYDGSYLKKKDAKPVSITLPLQGDPFKEKTMLPFFDGLIPEGWMLDIITDNWKVNERDRMSLLLLACKDCIGNVSIVPEEDE